jgi:hypothetical protein
MNGVYTVCKKRILSVSVVLPASICALIPIFLTLSIFFGTVIFPLLQNQMVTPRHGLFKNKKNPSFGNLMPDGDFPFICVFLRITFNRKQ